MNAALERKVDTEDVVNSLTTTEAGKALDARQGKILNDNKLDKSKVYNGLDQTQHGYALDARAAVKLDSGLGNIEEMAAVSVGPAASVSIDYANAKDAPFAKVLLYVKIEQQGSGTPSAGNVRPFVPQSNFSISVDTGGFMPQTISFRMMQSLYGGIIDLVNQKYIRVYGYIPTYGGESLPGVWYSSKDVYAEGATPSTGAEVVYALATPVVESISVATFNMTPKTVHAITAGTGVSSVSASYFTDDKLVTEAQMNAAIQQSTAKVKVLTAVVPVSAYAYSLGGYQGSISITSMIGYDDGLSSRTLAYIPISCYFNSNAAVCGVASIFGDNVSVLVNGSNAGDYYIKVLQIYV
jgi:hypothetical protein